MNFDLSERDCLRCYSWSRMAVRDYKTKRGAYEATHLPFEGFLEVHMHMHMHICNAYTRRHTYPSKASWRCDC